MPGRDEPVQLELVRSRRKTLELRVFPDGRVQVRAPLRTAQRHIDEFVEERRDWLRAHLEAAEKNPIRTLRYEHGEAHLLLGRPIPLNLEHAPRARTTLTDQGLLVKGPDLSSATVSSRMDRWYRAQAQIIFNELIDRHFPWFGERGYLRPKLTIRKMKTRWGSLSSRSGMSLNLELIKVPVPLIEYVVIHELCHLEHHDHGRGFKDLMSYHLPDWQEKRRALNNFSLVAN